MKMPTDPPAAAFLSMWTVYDHPKDYPDGFIARRWEIRNDPLPTNEVVASHGIEHIRWYLKSKGLACLPRQPGDDPCIVETWL